MAHFGYGGVSKQAITSSPGQGCHTTHATRVTHTESVHPARVTHTAHAHDTQCPPHTHTLLITTLHVKFQHARDLFCHDGEWAQGQRLAEASEEEQEEPAGQLGGPSKQTGLGKSRGVRQARSLRTWKREGTGPGLDAGAPGTLSFQ